MAVSVAVRTTRNRALLDEWSLVLRAADIPHATARAGSTYTLTVDSPWAGAAIESLNGYDAERRTRQRAQIPAAGGATHAAWLTGSAILLIHMMLVAADLDAAATARGASRSTAIHQGEWWRTITALTLHADALHALSNAVCAVLFLSPLCQFIGGGAALALTVIAGATGNLLNAILRGAGYSGIGASTAIFAALGILAGLRSAWGDSQPPWRRLRPIAAAVALLAMLGASPHTDVIAHLFGLACGITIGAVFGRARRAPFADPIDRGLLAATGAAFIFAWAAAMAAHA